VNLCFIWLIGSLLGASPKVNSPLHKNKTGYR
jgi:hypothetical protein